MRQHGTTSSDTAAPHSLRPDELDRIHCGDCVEGIRRLPADSIDVAVFSPPYDAVRDYNGAYTFDLNTTGEELFRVLRPGGIAAMVIQDQTVNFAKSLTSFRTIVNWCDNIGFRLFETVIYRKHGTEGAWWKYRFRVDHEYIPLFLKGARPQYFNKEPLKIPSKHGGKVLRGSGNRRTDGTTTATVKREINGTKCRGTVWNYLMAGDKNPLKRQHPAVFPDQIPIDVIQCFCPEQGVVLDPFMGSGSTAVAAKKLGRHYIGFDINPEYCELAEKRLREVTAAELQLFE
jgi:site-specific DNA-methyltransferase (adenine-specific)